MTSKPYLTTAALLAAFTCGGVTFAQTPVVNIGNAHGNLRAAQSYIVQAYQRIDAAQRDNQDQLGGHAQRAKDLLMQADAELRAAANVSNSEDR